MRRTILSTIIFVVAALTLSSSAEAQTVAAGASSQHGRGPGVGAVTMLNGMDGAMFTWGSGGWHMDALFGLRHYRPNAGNSYTTAFSLGGRFWYHVHAAQFADFSLGGGLGLVRYETNPGNPGNDDRLDLLLQVGGQMRAFIVPNVALLADVGIGAYFGPDDNILIGGNSIGGGGFVQGTLGIAYFFE